MKFRILVCLLLCIPCYAASGGLITNPGNDDALISGEIAGWTEVAGTNWTRRTNNPDPHAGDAYFFAGSGDFAELSQTIDVSSFASNIDASKQLFSFSGYLRSFDQSNPDASRILLEFQDAGGSVLDAFDSGQIVNRTGWQLISDQRLAPIGTREIEVRLQSFRNSGTNNDGYFDTLSLTTNAVPEPSSALVLGTLCGVAVAFRRSRSSRKMGEPSRARAN